VPSSLFAFSFPAFSRLSAEGSGRRADITRLYRQYLAVIVGTAFGIASLILLLRQDLLSLFAGSAPYGGPEPALVLLVVSFFILSCNIAPYYLLLALGRSKAVSLTSTGSMVVALALMTVLIPPYGLAGAAIARLANGVGTCTLLERAHRALGRA
jgi:O-antigen/teichoic acid export membrane protein